MKKSSNKVSLNLITAILVFSLANTIDIFAQEKETEKEKNEDHYGLKAGIDFAKLLRNDLKQIK
jgi:hypothetical protein